MAAEQGESRGQAIVHQYHSSLRNIREKSIFPKTFYPPQNLAEGFILPFFDLFFG